jgi:diguanylate cyclase (GGDEF)-like protein
MNVEFVSNVYVVDNTKVIQCNIRDITERKELEEKLKILASHDELTGCVNFKSTMELLEKEIARSRRYQKQFSIIMIDLDDFKSKNDEYGHQAGNDILVAFAAVIKNSLRGIDSVGRYGGEEFIVILHETDAQHALVAFERIKHNLEQTKITLPDLDKAKEITLKFSAGIVAFPHNAKDLKELIWMADNALRQAKQEGKNRAVLERRKSIRLNPMPGTRIEVVDSSGKENVGALQIADISKEGMLFLSTQDILGEEFLCRIYSPKEESPFELTCKVKHKEKLDNELNRIGIYFPDIPESSKEKLSQCIESLN